MPDKYANFAALEASEAADAYAIRLRDAGGPIVVAAPHGGGIEPGTSEIALAIASEDLSYYLFEGKKAQGNRDLHITSSNFDEPQCLRLLRAARVVVTVHGEETDAEIVYLGGLHTAAITSVRAALEQCGFEVREHVNSRLHGAFSKNICNIGRSGAGLQLELSRGLRSSFFRNLSVNGRNTPTTRLATFSTSVHHALREGGL